MNHTPAINVQPAAARRNAAAGATTATSPSTSSAMPSPVPSAVLLRGQKSVAIEHQGSIYRLQVTKLGKLILTK